MYYENFIKLQDKHHPECMFNVEALDSMITFNEDGELISHFDCNEKYQGYPGRIHGGILSGIIDSAMTKCLFGHKIIAYTVRLNIKYSHPVVINKEAVIKVNLKKKSNNHIYNVNAIILQDNKRCVIAAAKFYKKEI